MPLLQEGIRVEGDVMGCEGFYVDRRDLEEKREKAFVMRAYWPSPEHGMRLMDLWDVAKRGREFDRSEFDWRILSKLTDACMIPNTIEPANLSKMGDISHELHLTVSDLLEQSGFDSLVILDWTTSSAQEYKGETIEEIFYKEEGQ